MRLPLQQLLLALAIVGLAAGGFVLGQVSGARSLVTPDEVNTVEVASDALRAVVRVNVRLPREVLQPGDSPEDVGSGFFYRPNLIVTNYHVVQLQEAITVTLFDGRELPARLEGTDPGVDIAILRVAQASPHVLAFAPSAALLPGQKVMTVGSPLGLQNFLSTGVYSTTARASQLPRQDQLGEEISDYLITTASIQRGASGGPLLNSRGQVVGVANANASPSQLVPGIIGVAIPGDIVRQSVSDLERAGTPLRGSLGITMLDLAALDPAFRDSLGLTSSEGALVVDVPAGSNGARAGLQASLTNLQGQFQLIGDVIVAVDGERVRNQYDVVRLVAAKRAGERLRLRVWRGGREVNLEVVLGQRVP